VCGSCSRWPNHNSIREAWSFIAKELLYIFEGSKDGKDSFLASLKTVTGADGREETWQSAFWNVGGWTEPWSLLPLRVEWRELLFIELFSSPNGERRSTKVGVNGTWWRSTFGMFWNCGGVHGSTRVPSYGKYDGLVCVSVETRNCRGL
jgi:hypothetical protein